MAAPNEILNLVKRFDDNIEAYFFDRLQRNPGTHDRLVYDLYGLSEDEIKIVEEATGKERDILLYCP